MSIREQLLKILGEIRAAAARASSRRATLRLKYDPDPDLMTPEQLAEYRRLHPFSPGRPDLRDPNQRPAFPMKDARLLTPEELRQQQGKAADPQEPEPAKRR